MIILFNYFLYSNVSFNRNYKTGDELLFTKRVRLRSFKKKEFKLIYLRKSFGFLPFAFSSAYFPIDSAKLEIDCLISLLS